VFDQEAAQELCQCTFFSDANSNHLALNKLTCLVRKFQPMKEIKCNKLYIPLSTQLAFLMKCCSATFSQVNCSGNTHATQRQAMAKEVK
jgi:hypothetical protein